MLKTIVSTSFNNSIQPTDKFEKIGNFGLLPLRAVIGKRMIEKDNHVLTQEQKSRLSQITAIVLSIILLPVVIPLTIIGAISTYCSSTYKTKTNRLNLHNPTPTPVEGTTSTLLKPLIPTEVLSATSLLPPTPSRLPAIKELLPSTLQSAPSSAPQLVQTAQQMEGDRQFSDAILQELTTQDFCELTYNVQIPDQNFKGCLSQKQLKAAKFVLPNFKPLDQTTKLSWDYLKKIFTTLNHFVASRQYTLTPDLNRNICRPNHNGSHQTRELAFLVNLIEMVKKSDSQYSAILSDPEFVKQCLLAMYFRNIARVNEHCFIPSMLLFGTRGNKELSCASYNYKSSLMYKHVATQLGIDHETIELFKYALTFAGAPYDSYAKDLVKNDQSKEFLVWMLFTLAHELDLYRCFPPTSYEKEINKHTESFCRLVLGQSNEQARKTMQALMSQARNTGSKTGIHSSYTQFLECSLDTQHCLTTVGLTDEKMKPLLREVAS